MMTGLLPSSFESVAEFEEKSEKHLFEPGVVLRLVSAAERMSPPQTRFREGPDKQHLRNNYPGLHCDL